MGSFIWLRQTWPDVGYDITRIPAGAVATCEEAQLALRRMAMYNKTVRFAQKYGR